MQLDDIEAPSFPKNLHFNVLYISVHFNQTTSQHFTKSNTIEFLKYI